MKRESLVRCTLAALAAACLSAPMSTAEDRVADARKARESVIRAHCRDAGLPYPPREIFLRAFKHEAEVEVWAREKAGAFVLVKTYAVLTPSGGPGPKRREGDRQVPEGFYAVDRFNPRSDFHLSLGLNYPNASDRVLSDREKPGGDIFIHGKNVTIGCLPLGDEAIEELYLLALDTKARGQRQIEAHIFPARMSGPGWTRFCEEAGNQVFISFWKTLQPGYDAFERAHELPRIDVARDGSYRVAR